MSKYAFKVVLNQRAKNRCVHYGQTEDIAECIKQADLGADVRTLQEGTVLLTKEDLMEVFDD